MSSVAVPQESDETESRWARRVSDILSPPVVWSALAIPVALQAADSTGRAVIWALVYILLVCWLPVVYIVWKVKRGAITDIHIKERKQRLRPFLVSIACSIVAIIMLILLRAPRLMPLFALFSLLQMAILMVVTFWWQISIHAMSISGAVAAAGILYGGMIAVLLFPLIVLVGAARIKLRRHTLAQIIAGGVVGAGMTALLFGVA